MTPHVLRSIKEVLEQRKLYFISWHVKVRWLGLIYKARPALGFMQLTPNTSPVTTAQPDVNPGLRSRDWTKLESLLVCLTSTLSLKSMSASKHDTDHDLQN